ncbi:MAG: hypothetical protein ACLQLC_13410 [Candidatus Sulfotelmatobacter sp.]
MRDKTAAEIADLIDGFLANRPARNREWYDFLDRSNKDPRLDIFRKQCKRMNDQFQSDKKSLDLDRRDRWQDATNELKKIAAQLRDLEKETQQ